MRFITTPIIAYDVFITVTTPIIVCINFSHIKILVISKLPGKMVRIHWC